MNAGYIYELECDIDFFKELKKFSTEKTDQQVSSAHDTESIQRCLITDDKLRKDHITLECGHKFNYVPLFKDVLFQKCSLLPKNISSKLVTTYTKNQPTTASALTYTNSPNNNSITQTTMPQNTNILSVMYNSSYNLETTKLQYNEIKCPYCRSITHNILPYYPYPDVCKVKYVNNPVNLSLPGIACEYEQFIAGTGSVTGSNNLFTTNESKTCRSQCLYNEKYDLMLCNKHLNKLETGTVPKRKSRKMSASSSSTISSTSPILVPQSPPQTRLRATKKNSCKSNSTDTADNSTETQNIIVSHHNPATTVCSFTLLSGPRKGALCGKSMWIPKTTTTTSTSTNAIHNTGLSAYCKAHYEKGCA
jgi:hypothetical protein